MAFFGLDGVHGAQGDPATAPPFSLLLAHETRAGQPVFVFAILVGWQPFVADRLLQVARSAGCARRAVPGVPEAPPAVICPEDRAVLRDESASEKQLPARLTRAVPAFSHGPHPVSSRRKPAQRNGAAEGSSPSRSTRSSCWRGNGAPGSAVTAGETAPYTEATRGRETLPASPHRQEASDGACTRALPR